MNGLQRPGMLNETAAHLATLYSTRNAKIAQERRDGLTFEAIASRHGITRQRACQIAMREERKLRNQRAAAMLEARNGSITPIDRG